MRKYVGKLYSASYSYREALPLLVGLSVMKHCCACLKSDVSFELTDRLLIMTSYATAPGPNAIAQKLAKKRC